MVFSANTPVAGGSQEEAGHLVVEQSPWGGSGKREARVRVPPNGVGLRTGFKSSIEIKCWAEKLDWSPDVRPEATCGEEEGQKQEQVMLSVHLISRPAVGEAEIMNVFLTPSAWLHNWAGQNLQGATSASGALRREEDQGFCCRNQFLQ